MAGGKGNRDASTDEGREELAPTEMHLKRYAEIIEELKGKVLAMYQKSRHGGIVLHGCPSSLLDEVDLLTPSQRHTKLLREEINRITAHALIRQSEAVINRMDNIVVKLVMHG